MPPILPADMTLCVLQILYAMLCYAMTINDDDDDDCKCVTALCPFSTRDNCSCHLLHDKMMSMPMTSLSFQATAPPPPQLPLIPLRSMSPPASSNQLCTMDNCYPWIQLYRKVAGDLRNSAVDPCRLSLRLNTLPPPPLSGELNTVRVGIFDSNLPPQAGRF